MITMPKLPNFFHRTPDMHGAGGFYPHPSRKFVPGGLYICIHDTPTYFSSPDDLLQKKVMGFAEQPCVVQGDYVVFLYSEITKHDSKTKFPSAYGESIACHFLFNGLIIATIFEQLYPRFYRVQ